MIRHFRTGGAMGPSRWLYQVLKGWVASMSWLDVAWILVATVVIAAAGAAIFLLGAYVLGLFQAGART
jgi:hypothetical protein